MCWSNYYFFFNDTATTEIYTYLHTLSLHDALPILRCNKCRAGLIVPGQAFHFRTSQAHHPQARGAQKQDFAPVPVAIGRQQVRGQANRPRYFRPAATAPIERAPVHRNTQAQAAPGPNESPCGMKTRPRATECRCHEPSGRCQGQATDSRPWDIGEARRAAHWQHPHERKSVVSGKRVYVSVDLGGRRIIKKKK